MLGEGARTYKTSSQGSVDVRTLTIPNLWSCIAMFSVFKSTSTSKPPFTILVPPLIYPAGSAVEGEVELDFRRLLEENIEKVQLRLHGTTETYTSLSTLHPDPDGLTTFSGQSRSTKMGPRTSSASSTPTYPSGHGGVHIPHPAQTSSASPSSSSFPLTYPHRSTMQQHPRLRQSGTG